MQVSTVPDSDRKRTCPAVLAVTGVVFALGRGKETRPLTRPRLGTGRGIAQEAPRGAPQRDPVGISEAPPFFAVPRSTSGTRLGN